MPDRQFYAKALKDLYCSEKTIRPTYALPLLSPTTLDPTINPFTPSEAQREAAITYFRAVWHWWWDQKRQELLSLCPSNTARKFVELQFYPDDGNFDLWLNQHIYGTGYTWSFVKRIERAPDEETWWRIVAVAPLAGMFLNEIASTAYSARHSNFPAPKVQLQAEREFYLAEQGLKAHYLLKHALEVAGYNDLNETFGIPKTLTDWGRTTCSLQQYYHVFNATLVEELKGWVETRAGVNPLPTLWDDLYGYAGERLDFHFKSFLIPYIREQVEIAQKTIGEPKSILVTLPDGQTYRRDNYTYDAFQDVKKFRKAIHHLRSWLGWGTPYGYVLASNNILHTTDMVPANIRRLIEWIDTPYPARPIGDETVHQNAGFSHWTEFTTVLKKEGFDTDEEIRAFIDYYLSPSVVPTRASGAELTRSIIPILAIGGLSILYWYSRR